MTDLLTAALRPTQCGGLPGRSTSYAVQFAALTTERLTSTNTTTIRYYIDLTAAFHTVIRETVFGDNQHADPDDTDPQHYYQLPDFP